MSAHAEATRPDRAAEGRRRQALETAMVALFKQYYGKGPAAAKAILRDEYVVVVLEGGLTRNEETLIKAGQEDQVRRFRLAFQQSVQDEAKQAVSQATGRTVVAYQSQVTFHPFRGLEFFLLDSAPLRD